MNIEMSTSVFREKKVKNVQKVIKWLSSTVKNVSRLHWPLILDFPIFRRLKSIPLKSKSAVTSINARLWTFLMSTDERSL